MRKSGLYNHLTIEYSASILQALKKMDTEKCKLLIVIDNDLYVSMLSIGDIQRAIIANEDINAPIKTILRSDVRVARVGDDMEAVKERMLAKRNEFMPIINAEGYIENVIFWKDLFNDDTHVERENLNLPVVIMAGGQGSRLRPLTNVLPKPLIPIGKQSMMEDIMDMFSSFGCTKFFVSVNYKAEVIKSYFDTLSSKRYDLTYFQEDKPLGTAGSLHLIKDKIKSTFFVSNCDTIINEDYSAILRYHRENNNEITLVTALKTYDIPYGIVETTTDGLLDALSEKPSLSFQINAGFYILEPHLLNEIPEDKLFHITHLMEIVIKRKGRVGCFPINEGSWTDIGNWQEYMDKII